MLATACTYRCGLRNRLDQEGLLQQSGVEAPLVLDVSDFETLMSIAACGEDIFRVLDLCLTRQAGAATFRHVVHELVPAHFKKRLPILEREFKGLNDRILSRFARPGKTRSPIQRRDTDSAPRLLALKAKPAAMTALKLPLFDVRWSHRIDRQRWDASRLESPRGYTVGSARLEATIPSRL